MERVGEDDPYGALVKFCRPTSSQEQKLQNCHFARAGETFPDAFDSLGSSFSQAPTQSPPPVIVMVSLPDSDEEEEPPNDDNAPVENELYQTPPEEHNTSYCSSQEEIQRNLKLVPIAGDKIEAETKNDGDSALGLENLGFPGPSEDAKGSESNEFGVSERNLGEPPWKKVRVSGVNWESPVPDTVEEAEVVATQKACDDVDDDDDGELIDMVIEESDEESGPTGAGSDGGEGMSDCINNGGEKSVSSDGDLVVEETEDGEKSVSSDGDLVVEETENGEKSVSSDGDLVVEEVGNGEKSGGDLVVEEVRNDSGAKLACMDSEDIYAFKYDTGSGGGGGENEDQRWKEVARKKRELPASMREKKCNDSGGQKSDEDAKDLSWEELFDRLAAVAMLKKKKAVHDAEEEDVDFLETAKRRGMTFPQPRWKIA